MGEHVQVLPGGKRVAALAVVAGVVLAAPGQAVAASKPFGKASVSGWTRTWTNGPTSNTCNAQDYHDRSDTSVRSGQQLTDQSQSAYQYPGDPTDTGSASATQNWSYKATSKKAKLTVSSAIAASAGLGTDNPSTSGSDGSRCTATAETTGDASIVLKLKSARKVSIKVSGNYPGTLVISKVNDYHGILQAANPAAAGSWKSHDSARLGKGKYLVTAAAEDSRVIAGWAQSYDVNQGKGESLSATATFVVHLANPKKH
jgi:hypothetical protein